MITAQAAATDAAPARARLSLHFARRFLPMLSNGTAVLHLGSQSRTEQVSYLRHRRRPLLVRVARLCWRLIANVQFAGCVFRVLLSPVYVGVWAQDPRFPVKCLFHGYLAQGLSIQQSVACFVHHYKRLRELLPDHTFHRLFKHDVVLHQVIYQGHKVTLSVAISRHCDKEGELSLSLSVDAAVVFTLSFTIVPGYVVGLNAADAILISRIQGAPSCYPYRLRLATKALRGVLPRLLLFSALEGVAMGLGIENIAAVPSTRQSSFTNVLARYFGRSYDRFFVELGMRMTSAEFFTAIIPLAGKALSEIKRSHRSTAKRRRSVRNHVRMICSEVFVGTASRDHN